MTEIITTEQAIGTVERLLADPKYGPEHVATCAYLDSENKPLCIIGHIISEHAPDALLALAEDESGMAYLNINQIAGRGLVAFESDALLKAATKAQLIQDGDETDDRTWGTAAQPILALRGES